MKQAELLTKKALTRKRINFFLLILLSVYFSLYFLYPQDSTNFDYGKLVKYGEVILENGQVFNTNYFSYTHPDYEFVNHHWGTGVIFYVVHRISGFEGLTILGLILQLTSFLLIFTLAKRTGNMPLTLLLTILAFPLLTSRNQPRPEIFSILFFTLTIFLLTKYYRKEIEKKWLLVLPIMQLLWVNVHVLFFFGLFLQGSMLIQMILKNNAKKDLYYFSMIFLVSIAFSFINPFLEEAVFYPLNIMGDIQYAVTENIPFYELSAKRDFPIYFIQFEVLFGIGLLMIYFWVRNRKKAFPHLYLLVWIIVFGLFTLYRVRACVFFGYIFILFGNQTLAISGNKESISLKKLTNALNIAAILLVFLIPLWHYFPYSGRDLEFGAGIDKKLDDAAVFFKEHNIQGPIFNNFDVGDYLIYYLFPKERVFVDSRPEAYPPGFFEEKLVPALFDERKWLNLDYKYNFNVIFLGKHLQVLNFINRRLRDSNWFVVYNDRYNIIFVENNAKNNHIIRNDLIRKRNLEIMQEQFEVRK